MKNILSLSRGALCKPCLMLVKPFLQAFLNGQLKAQEEQLLKAETERKNYENKLKELEQNQQSFYDQLLHNDQTTFAKLDQRLHVHNS
jgi:hypothetical protein